MRTTLVTAALVLGGLALLPSRGAPVTDGQKLRIVYSSDLRGELHPCG